MELEQRKYPVGKLAFKKKYSEKDIQKNIKIISQYPAKYKKLVKKMSEEDLDKTYREGGWSARQVMIHIADMHILHFARFKQALADENPVGFAANIDGWNALPEVDTAPIMDAVMLFEATHKRWVHLLRKMRFEDFNRTFHHPLRNADLTLAQALAMGAWHSRHHFEHIRIAVGAV